jgi:hypothetical protein
VTRHTWYGGIGAGCAEEREAGEEAGDLRAVGDQDPEAHPWDSWWDSLLSAFNVR